MKVDEAVQEALDTIPEGLGAQTTLDLAMAIIQISSIAKQEREEMCAALMSCVPPLILLGDYIGNKFDGKIGMSPFDRCATLLAVCTAVEKYSDAVRQARGILDAT